MSQDMYFLRDAENVKVGITGNFKSRFSSLQIGNSRNLEVVGLWAVEDEGLNAPDFERLMHRLLKPYHIRGEWFKVTNEELDTVHRYAWSLRKSGFLHYRTDPCRVAKKSGASPSAVSAKPDSDTLGKVASRANPDQPMVALAVTDHGVAFTSSAGMDEDKDRQPNSVVAKSSTTQYVHKLHILKKPRGRPRIHPDRKAYKAQHERDRRARKKENGNAAGDTKR